MVVSRYTTMLDSIALKYGVPQKHVYGGTSLPSIQADQSNIYTYQRLKNQIVYTNPLQYILENQGQIERGGWK